MIARNRKLPVAVDLKPASGLHEARTGEVVSCTEFPAGHELAILIVQPFFGIVLSPAASRATVNDHLYEPAQHRSGLGAGGAVLGAETVIVLAAHNTGLSDPLHCVFHAASNLVIVCKYHGLPHHGEAVPRLVGVLLHNDFHLFTDNSDIGG